MLGVKNVMDAIGSGLGLGSQMGRLRAQVVAIEQHFGLLAPGERPSRPSPISSEFRRLPPVSGLTAGFRPFTKKSLYSGRLSYQGVLITL